MAECLFSPQNFDNGNVGHKLQLMTAFNRKVKVIIVCNLVTHTKDKLGCIPEDFMQHTVHYRSKTSPLLLFFARLIDLILTQFHWCELFPSLKRIFFFHCFLKSSRFSLLSEFYIKKRGLQSIHQISKHLCITRDGALHIYEAQVQS